MKNASSGEKSDMGNPHVKKIVLFAAVSAVCLARASELLCDFETEEEFKRYAVPAVAGRYMGVTNEFATSGSHALLFAYEYWLRGDWKYSAYASIDIPVPERLSDWRQFDRLSFDIVNERDGGDQCCLYARDKNGKSQIVESFPLPGNTVTRHIMPIDAVNRTSVPFKQVSTFSVIVRTPRGCWLHVDNFRLYRPGEEVPSLDVGPQGRETVRFMDRKMREAQAEAKTATARVMHLESLFKFRAACEKAGTATGGFAVGKASPMTMVRPRDAFSADPADKIDLSLARNESESVQILVTPTVADLKNVRVTVSDLVCGSEVFPASDVHCIPVGYVKAETPGYRRHPGVVPEPGWYPDTLLTFLDGVDVKGDDVQSFWVRVTCPEKRAAGSYTGTLTVTADNAKPFRVPFAVRVRDFAVGRISPLHLELAFVPKLEFDHDPKKAARFRANPKWPGNLWQKHEDAWTDFLADYYITIGSIYNRGKLNLRQLKRLKEQGRLGDVSLGYWNPIWADGEDIVERFRKNVVGPIRANYLEAKAAGVLGARPFVYGADEYAPKAEVIRRVKKSLEILREAVPEAMVTTTGFIRGTNGMFDPHGLGLGEPDLAGVDMFIPTIGAYSVAMVEHGVNWIEKVRATGKKVGWYICNNPDHPFPQMFLEVHPIESRLIVGAMAEKCHSDAFLIWSICAWNCDHCIASGPFTDWDPRTFLTDNSDAQWVCPGPDGTPLATIRLENFRDGLEDLWYVRAYEKKFGHAPEVPENLVHDPRNFSRDPVTLQEWRDRLAEAIETGRESK